MRGRMRSNGAMGWMVCVAIYALGILTLPALAKDKKPPERTQMIVTVVNHVRGGGTAPTVTSADVIVKENGKQAAVTAWQPVSKQDKTQLVILIDDSLSAGASINFSSISQFILALPPSVQVAVGYMQYGRVAIAAGFTADRNTVAKSIRLPSGIRGVNASPYLCLSDLAKNWPYGGSPATVRQVLMITDGIDRYFDTRRYDPGDPYLNAAIKDAQKNRLIVSSIYYRDVGFVDRGLGGSFVGGSYLIQVAEATGGKTYYEGMGNPVTFDPFLKAYMQRLASAYVLGFEAYGSGLQSLKVNTKVHGVRLAAPDHVVVGQQLPMAAAPPPTSVARVSP